MDNALMKWFTFLVLLPAAAALAIDPQLLREYEYQGEYRDWYNGSAFANVKLTVTGNANFRYEVKMVPGRFPPTGIGLSATFRDTVITFRAYISGSGTYSGTRHLIHFTDSLSHLIMKPTSNPAVTTRNSDGTVPGTSPTIRAKATMHYQKGKGLLLKQVRYEASTCDVMSYRLELVRLNGQPIDVGPLLGLPLAKDQRIACGIRKGVKTQGGMVFLAAYDLRGKRLEARPSTLRSPARAAPLL